MKGHCNYDLRSKRAVVLLSDEPCVEFGDHVKQRLRTAFDKLSEYTLFCYKMPVQKNPVTGHPVLGLMEEK